MSHFGKAPEELVRTFENAMKDFPMAEQRKTFGYPSAFINGNMFTGLHNDKMILRLSLENAAQMPDATPFERMPGRPMKGWVVVPSSVLKSPRLLWTWLNKGMEYAKSLSLKGGKK